jgi:mannose-binding lectin 1
MHLPRHILTFLSLISFTLASDHRFEHDYVEDGVVDDLTFGNDASIWAKDHRHITGWSISGTGYTPKLHSDRIVLTPPWPGSRRGAVWADHAVESSEWEAEFEFRATGPDNGNGNLQFWYVRSEPLAESVGSSSVYTVGKFDGVAVVVSQSGNKGGTVRAFLNDGSLSFRDHHKVDDLSFGQCDFQYRNLGKFSKIKVKRTYWTFKVEVDGKSCINTYSVCKPQGMFDLLLT